MKQRIVGIYDLGPEQVQLVLREGTGGEFYMVPEKGVVPRIKVGADHEKWWQVVSTLLHEATELEMARIRCRFCIHPDYGHDNGEFHFILTHGQFSEVCGRVALFLAACLPDLATAWKGWKKPARITGLKRKRVEFRARRIKR